MTERDELLKYLNTLVEDFSSEGGIKTPEEKTAFARGILRGYLKAFEDLKLMSDRTGVHAERIIRKLQRDWKLDKK